MSDRHEGQVMHAHDPYESGFTNGAHSAESLSPSENVITSAPAKSTRSSPSIDRDLGSPLTIEEVADLLGCSPWTIRQRYLRQGLPYLQASARGKLTFFREQIIAWVEKRQRQKGGLLR